jgi:hypothetical protein
MIVCGGIKPEMYYERKWLGHIRFQGRIVKISSNFGCFITSNSYESLPKTLKVTNARRILLCLKILNNKLPEKDATRINRIIKPDLKYITSAFLNYYGFAGHSQGSSKLDLIAEKLISFLEQLALMVSL